MPIPKQIFTGSNINEIMVKKKLNRNIIRGSGVINQPTQKDKNKKIVSASVTNLSNDLKRNSHKMTMSQTQNTLA